MSILKLVSPNHMMSYLIEYTTTHSAYCECSFSVDEFSIWNYRPNNFSSCISSNLWIGFNLSSSHSLCAPGVHYCRRNDNDVFHVANTRTQSHAPGRLDYVRRERCAPNVPQCCRSLLLVTSCKFTYSKIWLSLEAPIRMLPSRFSFHM